MTKPDHGPSSLAAHMPHPNDPTAPLSRRAGPGVLGERAVPVLLVAHAPDGASPVDRCAITPGFSVGRGDRASLQILDPALSRQHFRIVGEGGDHSVEDGGSRNGTFLQGERVVGRRTLCDGAVLRAGRALFTFYSDGRALLLPPPAERYGIDGAFFAGPLVEALQEASRSSRHLLLSGPSGTGKERAARALAVLASPPGAPVPLIAHNAARYATEEEAATSLFGVAPRVFSQVDARIGLIETARNGFLLLDEVHALPERLQRSLLRVVEDGLWSRVGETRTQPARVRFIFASNVQDATSGLIPDLRARLRLVPIAALRERIADIPAIFVAVLSEALLERGREPASVLREVEVDDLELLCLDGLPDDNVRGLIDLADRVVSRVERGIEPAEAVRSVFAERFRRLDETRSPDPEQGADSHYERLKPIILEVYHASGKNLSAVERELKARGIACSWRWLSVYLKRWGVRD